MVVGVVLLLCEGGVGEAGGERTRTRVVLMGQSQGGLRKLEDTFTKWTNVFSH